MSTHNGSSIKSYDSRTAAEIDQLVDTVTAALDSVGADSDVIEAIEEQGQQTAQAADKEIEELQEKIESEGDRRSAEIEGCHSRISRVEEETEDTNPGSETAETDSQQPETALEQICSLPEETAEENLTANQRRARILC